MRIGYLLAAALAAALILTVRWDGQARGDFAEEVARAALSEEIRRDGGARCPLNDRALAEAPHWVLSACAAGGLSWHEAARRYGDDAEKVFRVYGQDEVFSAVFERLGPAVVPVIAYFVRNGSTQYLVGETIGQSLSRLWNEGRPGLRLAELSPEQYGLLAVHELDRRGHEMLSEFEIADGVAVRKPLTRALLGAKNIVFGGVSDLEAVIARGERLPTWGEMGWAALDAAIVVGGAGAAVKTLRAAKTPAMAAARATPVAYLRTAGKGAAESLVAVGKAAGVAAAVAIPYVAVTRPGLFASAGGWLAEQAGLPGWLGAFAAYAVLCLVLAWLVRIVLRPVAWLMRPALWIVRGPGVARLAGTT